MSAIYGATTLDAMRRARKAVLVVDVVESVRLIERAEEDVVRRWRHFVHGAVNVDAAERGGRFVKSLGDGLMLEFDEPRDAVRCAFALHARTVASDQGRTPEARIALRAGIHVAEVFIDEIDLYGAGVNLAARLTTLSRPGETVVSGPVRDMIVDGIDATIEDLGACHLKHVAEPVRAYRVRPPGSATDAAFTIPAHAVDFEPALAVVPFRPRLRGLEHEAVGDLIADRVIAQLSQSPLIRVISRLSTAAIRSADIASSVAAGLLGATYVLCGSFAASGKRLLVTAELCQANKREVVWSGQFSCELGELLEPHSETLERICSGTQQAVLRTEVMQAQTQPLPTLSSYTLLLSAISMLHRSTPAGFVRVHAILDHLVERHPRNPIPRAWLAKWYAMRVVNGLSPATPIDAQMALGQTSRALDTDPNCSLALAIQGFVHCHMLHDLDQAYSCLRLATAVNPSESLAWLFMGVVHAFRSEADHALQASERALSLSPLDPLVDFYRSLAASGALPSGNYARVIELASESLRVNRMHPSTWRVLAIAQALSGRLDEARVSTAELLKLEPGFSIETFVRRSPSSRYAIGKLCVDALRRCGVPEAS